MSELAINLDEKFPNLDKPPIVEAAIYWRAEPVQPLDPGVLLPELKRNLPEYPKLSPQHELTVEHQIGPQGTQLNQRQSWEAFQLAHERESYVCQFRRDGLVVSRLPPYENWAPFRDEALRLWRVYREIVDPPEIKRVGIRYINLVPVESASQAARMLRKPPEFPGDLTLPMESWVHQSRFAVPGQNLLLNLVQTIQPSPPGSETQLNLIVDFDIFSTDSRLSMDDFDEGDLFPNMRWLKNKAFFSIFSSEAIQTFEG